MAKSEMLHARIDAELKEKAESIFSQLGITSAEAIKMFYKQVELNGGLPFELKVPNKVQAQAKLLAQLKEAEDAVANGNGWMSIGESRKNLGDIEYGLYVENKPQSPSGHTGDLRVYPKRWEKHCKRASRTYLQWAGKIS